MKQNRIYLLLLSVIFPMTLLAERQKVTIKMDPKGPSQISIKRSPLHLPIEVVYDSETSTIEVSCYSDIDGEVSLYDNSGNLEDNAPSLNAVLYVTSDGPHTLIIEGESFVGYGSIE